MFFARSHNLRAGGLDSGSRKSDDCERISAGLEQSSCLVRNDSVGSHEDQPMTRVRPVSTLAAIWVVILSSACLCRRQPEARNPSVRR